MYENPTATQFAIARKMMGMKQIEIAAKAGLSKTEISLIETGKSKNASRKQTLKKFYERNGIGFGADGKNVFKIILTCDTRAAERQERIQRQKNAAQNNPAKKVRLHFASMESKKGNSVSANL